MEPVTGPGYDVEVVEPGLQPGIEETRPPQHLRGLHNLHDLPDQPKKTHGKGDLTLCVSLHRRLVAVNRKYPNEVGWSISYIVLSYRELEHCDPGLFLVPPGPAHAVQRPKLAQRGVASPLDPWPMLSIGLSGPKVVYTDIYFIFGTTCGYSFTGASCGYNAFPMEEDSNL